MLNKFGRVANYLIRHEMRPEQLIAVHNIFIVLLLYSVLYVFFFWLILRVGVCFNMEFGNLIIYS